LEYLYRAIDRDGALVDVMLSEHHNLAAAKAIFRSAKAVTGVTPDRVTTDGHDAYPRAIRTELGKRVRHRTNRYLTDTLLGYWPFAGPTGSTAATPSGLRLKARNVSGSLPGFPH